MRISIITVTYNAERFLDTCIRSVLSQTYHDIEYIVIDGQSADSTLDIIRSYGSRITKAVSEKDNGMYDALNKGINLSTGDVVGILNADDFFASPHAVELIAQSFTANPIDILYGDLDYVDASDVGKIVRRWRTSPYFKGAFQWGWMPAHPTFYAKRRLFENYGMYKPEFGSAADFELMLRFIHKHELKTFHLNEVLIKMRNGGMSNNSLKSRLKANKNDFEAMKLNDIRFPVLAAIMKPLRKVPQFLGF